MEQPRFPKSKQPAALSNLGGHSGTPMGRRNIIGTDPEVFNGTMHLTLVKMVDHDYDEGGAYWGAATPRTGWLYRAWYYQEVDEDVHHVDMFVRGITRRDAKRAIQRHLPHARFYK